MPNWVNRKEGGWISCDIPIFEDELFLYHQYVQWFTEFHKHRWIPPSRSLQSKIRIRAKRDMCNRVTWQLGSPRWLFRRLWVGGHQPSLVVPYWWLVTNQQNQGLPRMNPLLHWVPCRDPALFFSPSVVGWPLYLDSVSLSNWGRRLTRQVMGSCSCVGVRMMGTTVFHPVTKGTGGPMASFCCCGGRGRERGTISLLPCSLTKVKRVGGGFSHPCSNRWGWLELLILWCLKTLN